MRIALLAVLLLLSSCSDPMPIDAFKTSTPVLDPIRFFTGHAQSWGVL